MLVQRERAVRLLHQLADPRLGGRELRRGVTHPLDPLLEQAQGAVEREALPLQLGDDRLQARQVLLERHPSSARTSIARERTRPSRSWRSNSSPGRTCATLAIVAPSLARATA